MITVTVSADYSNTKLLYYITGEPKSNLLYALYRPVRTVSV